MRLYHGSNVLGLNVLEPRLADHDRPYVYMTTIDAVAALYLCICKNLSETRFRMRGRCMRRAHEIWPSNNFIGAHGLLELWVSFVQN